MHGSLCLLPKTFNLEAAVEDQHQEVDNNVRLAQQRQFVIINMLCKNTNLVSSVQWSEQKNVAGVRSLSD
jgi:hypothetical protein